MDRVLSDIALLKAAAIEKYNSEPGPDWAPTSERIPGAEHHGAWGTHEPTVAGTVSPAQLRRMLAKTILDLARFRALAEFRRDTAGTVLHFVGD